MTASQPAKKSRNAFAGLADYAGASTARREYERQRKKALMDDPGSWNYRSFADWKAKNG